MNRRADAGAAPAGLRGAVIPSAVAVLLVQLAAAPAPATPDGAEWAVADDPEGCASCHFGEQAAMRSVALTLDGLPERPAAGQRYSLTITLEDPALENAGFLLSVRSDGAMTGTFIASDGRVEVMGSLARSTREGSRPAQPGKASWRLVWTAPAMLAGTLSFDLWANAGNDDLSPLGDRLHHRSFELRAQRATSQ